MDLRARFALVLSSLTLLSCHRDAEPQPIDDSILLPQWDVAIEPAESKNGLEVCVDGVETRPRATFVVRNNTGRHGFPVAFTPTGTTLTLSPPLKDRPDTAVSGGGVSRMFLPAESATIEVELLEPFSASPQVGIQLPLEPTVGRHSVNVLPIVDVRALDVALGPAADGKPTINVRNPFPFRAAITLASEGRWRVPVEREGIDGRASLTITLERADEEKALSETVAAKVVIDGDRCTKATLPEHGALEIP